MRIILPIAMVCLTWPAAVSAEPVTTVADALRALSSGPKDAADDPHPAMPVSNPGEWVTPDDYPKWALVAGVVGRVSFSLDVDDQGRVSACHVTHSSGVSDLDKAACDKITERARFKPATDQKGNSVRSTWSSTLNWSLPKRVMAMTSGELVANIVIEPDGSMSDCSIEKADGAAATNALNFCNEPRLFEPILDSTGKPQRRRVRYTMSSVIEPLSQ